LQQSQRQSAIYEGESPVGHSRDARERAADARGVAAFPDCSLSEWAAGSSRLFTRDLAIEKVQLLGERSAS